MPDFASFSTAHFPVAHQKLGTGLGVKHLLPLQFPAEFLLSVFNPSCQGATITRTNPLCFGRHRGFVAFRLRLWGFANEAVLQRVAEVHEMPVLLLFYILMRLCKRRFRECTGKVTETRK